MARNGEPEVAALHLRVRLDEHHALRRASKRCSEIESFGDADGMEVGVPHLDVKYVSTVSRTELDTLYLHCIWSLNKRTLARLAGEGAMDRRNVGFMCVLSLFVPDICF